MISQFKQNLDGGGNTIPGKRDYCEQVECLRTNCRDDDPRWILHWTRRPENNVQFLLPMAARRLPTPDRGGREGGRKGKGNRTMGRLVGLTKGRLRLIEQEPGHAARLTRNRIQAHVLRGIVNRPVRSGLARPGPARPDNFVR